MIELKLIPVTIEELRPLIHFSLQGDTDVIDKYQRFNYPFEECVDYVYNEIARFINDPVFAGDMQPYRIMLQSGDEMEDMGYCVTVTNGEAPNELYSYAINIAFRKKVFLVEWLRKVEEIIGAAYFTALWNKNSRAIQFFNRNGFEEVPTKDGTFVLLIKNKYLLLKRNIPCQ